MTPATILERLDAINAALAGAPVPLDSAPTGHRAHIADLAQLAEVLRAAIERPLGLDPDETRAVEVAGVGEVRIGFIPRGKFLALQGEGLMLFEEGRAIGKGLVVAAEGDLPAADLWAQHGALKVRAHAHARELVAWTIRAWPKRRDPDQAAYEEREFDGRTYLVLDAATLDRLEGRGWIDALAVAAQEFWNLTRLEKKP